MVMAVLLIYRCEVTQVYIIIHSYYNTTWVMMYYNSAYVNTEYVLEYCIRAQSA